MRLRHDAPRRRGRPWENALKSLHISIGVTLLVLLVARVLVGVPVSPPPLPLDLSALNRGAAHLGHFALLALSAVVIYLGWVKENIDGGVVQWFGVVMPRLFPVVEGSSGELPERQVEFLHRWGAYAMLALAAGYVGAIFKHR